MHDALTKAPHRGNGRSRPDFHYHRPAYVGQPLFHSGRLLGLALLQPVGIVEHENVGPRQGAAGRAPGQLAEQAALRRVDFGHESVGGPDGRGAGVHALQVVDGAVAFVNEAWVKPRFLELAVDVAGEHRMAQRHVLPPALEHSKARMWLRLAVEFESMTVKAPCPLRPVAKRRGAGNGVKVHLLATERRIGLPEAIRAPEVGQSRIDPHSGACRYDQGISLRDKVGSVCQGHGLEFAHRVVSSFEKAIRAILWVGSGAQQCARILSKKSGRSLPFQR